MFVATRLFEYIMAFSVVVNCFEPLKPLVTKLQLKSRYSYGIQYDLFNYA